MQNKMQTVDVEPHTYPSIRDNIDSVNVLLFDLFYNWFDK